jgi:hypothetical protein
MKMQDFSSLFVEGRLSNDHSEYAVIVLAAVGWGRRGYTELL